MLCHKIFSYKSYLNCHVKNIHQDLHTKTMDADDTWIAERGVGVVRKSGASVSKEVGQDIYKETEDDDGNGIFGDSDITNGSEADSDPPQHLGTYHHLSTKT